MGNAALAELTIAGHEWQNAYWAKNTVYMQSLWNDFRNGYEIDFLAQKLASYNPEALADLKKVFVEKHLKLGPIIVRKSSNFRKVSFIRFY